MNSLFGISPKPVISAITYGDVSFAIFEARVFYLNLKSASNPVSPKLVILSADL